MTVLSGLARIARGDRDVLARVRGRKIGLVANQASVTADLVHARDVLGAAGAQLEALFGPEHGFGGEEQDMIAVSGGRERESGIPVHTLYGPTEDSLSPSDAALAGLDALVVDLPDVGSRYYTFVWTAALALRAAAKRGVEIIVLDRPNPLGGEVVEGASQEERYLSFVGLHSVPVRHAMTIGEITTMVAAREGLSAGLHVVPMHGWHRAMSWEETRLPWVPPSPNMPTLDTARVYPGGCLIEGTSLSEGRGTTKPFEIWGAPGLSGSALASAVPPSLLDGLALRPLSFRPMFHKHAGLVCGGVQVHVIDAARAQSYCAYVALLGAAWKFLRDRGEARMRWRTEPYEFVHDRLAIDLLTGSPAVREAIEAGASATELADVAGRGAGDWRDRRRTWLLYA